MKDFTQTYGSASLTGYKFHDTVCLIGSDQDPNQNSCIKQFEFMAISSQKHLNDGINGILGLGADLKAAPSLFDNLKKSGIIKEAMFSFSLGSIEKSDQKSYMIFGGTNQTQYIGNLTNFSLKTNHWWALDMREMRYG